MEIPLTGMSKAAKKHYTEIERLINYGNKAKSGGLPRVTVTSKQHKELTKHVEKEFDSVTIKGVVIRAE